MYGEDYIFDLLDLAPKDPRHAAPRLDNRIKACFWHLVAVFLQRGSRVAMSNSDAGKIHVPPSLATLIFAAEEEGMPQRLVVGFIGGRSGSTDLPAFVGMRVFSWEEPLLTVLKGVDKPVKSPLNEPLTMNSSYYENQGPQTLRLFNQHAVMTTGFLDVRDAQLTKAKHLYKRICEEDGIFQTWLECRPLGSADITVLPRDVNKSMQNSIQFAVSGSLTYLARKILIVTGKFLQETSQDRKTGSEHSRILPG